MPLTTRQVYVRRRIAVVGLAGLLLAGGIYAPLTLLAPISPASAQVASFAAPETPAAELAWGEFAGSAVGAVGYDDVLAFSGSEAQLPIASITKVVTALVVLEERPLDLATPGPTIEFTQADVAIRQKFLAINGNVSPVRSGLTLTQRDVLNIVLIESANNYAESLATWAFGSEAAYVAAAQAWLVENSLTNTTIADSTGMSAMNTSTTSDLVHLGKLALANPLVSEIVSTTQVSIPQVGVYENRNELVGIDGIRGIKTGTLDEAGACLLFAADYLIGDIPVTVVGVVLGAVDHDQLRDHVATLLTQVKAGFSEVTLATKGEAFAAYDTNWGASSAAVAASTQTALVWSDAPVTLLVKAEKVALAQAGSSVGKLNFSVDGQTFTVPLVLSETIADPGPWWRLLHPIQLL
jgi:D-alanyl-D-alanine carboxypeptidase (penicillin-binding protein 5/6)